MQSSQITSHHENLISLTSWRPGAASGVQLGKRKRQDQEPNASSSARGPPAFAAPMEPAAVVLPAVPTTHPAAAVGPLAGVAVGGDAGKNAPLAFGDWQQPTKPATGHAPAPDSQSQPPADLVGDLPLQGPPAASAAAAPIPSSSRPQIIWQPQKLQPPAAAAAVPLASEPPPDASSQLSGVPAPSSRPQIIWQPKPRPPAATAAAAADPGSELPPNISTQPPSARHTSVPFSWGPTLHSPAAAADPSALGPELPQNASTQLSNVPSGDQQAPVLGVPKLPSSLASATVPRSGPEQLPDTAALPSRDPPRGPRPFIVWQPKSPKTAATLPPGHTVPQVRAASRQPDSNLPGTFPLPAGASRDTSPQQQDPAAAALPASGSQLDQMQKPAAPDQAPRTASGTKQHDAANAAAADPSRATPFLQQGPAGAALPASGPQLDQIQKPAVPDQAPGTAPGHQQRGAANAAAEPPSGAQPDQIQKLAAPGKPPGASAGTEQHSAANAVAMPAPGAQPDQQHDAANPGSMASEPSAKQAHSLPITGASRKEDPAAAPANSKLAHEGGSGKLFTGRGKAYPALALNPSPSSSGTGLRHLLELRIRVWVRLKLRIRLRLRLTVRLWNQEYILQCFIPARPIPASSRQIHACQ